MGRRGATVAVLVAVLVLAVVLVGPGARPAAADDTFPTFTPNELVAFLDRAQLPGTTPPGPRPAITGNRVADDRIAALAEATDYRRRPESTGPTSTAAGVPLNVEATTALLALQAAARGAGVPFVAVSGHRSPDDQRGIFLAELATRGRQRIGRPYTVAEIAAGAADAAIQDVLRLNSIPGYSFHHTGDTVDLTVAGQPLSAFAASGAYRWLAADDYAAAKTFGFVPSYPAGATGLGPDPEPWELTYVGVRQIRCAADRVVLSDRSPGRCPVGNLDLVVVEGTRVTALGWAADPDVPGVPVEVHVVVDGGVLPVVADRDRPDVGAATPFGSRHGFEAGFDLAPGAHLVCAAAINDVRSEQGTGLGCTIVEVRTRVPVGSLDRAEPAGTGVRVSGWAADPDRPGQAVDVHLVLDGGVLAVPADRPRADVDAVTGLGPAHGFTATLGASGGPHVVCAYAISPQAGEPNPLLGCQWFVAVGPEPRGSLDEVSATAGTLRVRGWAADPDHPATPTTVHVYVDGQGAAPLRADGDRPDVGAATPFGSGHGFTTSIAARPGPHQVCAHALALDPGEANVLLGCRVVVVPA